MTTNQQQVKQQSNRGPVDSAEFHATLFKAEVAKLTDTIMKYAGMYLRTRMFMRLFFRLQLVYDNNRPGWRNDPRSQSLLRKLETLEAQLKETKEIILFYKNLLMIAYEEVLTTHEEITKQCAHIGEDDLEAMEVKKKIDGMKKDVNCKMLHVVAAMELIMQANLAE